MKLPEYRLKKTIKISTGKFSNQDDPEFIAGTVVQPIWNDTLLPQWRKDELKEARRLTNKPLVMTIIGQHWVVVEVDNIRKDY